MLRRQSLEKNRSGNGLRNKQIKKKKIKKIHKALVYASCFSRLRVAEAAAVVFLLIFSMYCISVAEYLG